MTEEEIDFIVAVMMVKYDSLGFNPTPFIRGEVEFGYRRSVWALNSCGFSVALRFGKDEA